MLALIRWCSCNCLCVSSCRKTHNRFEVQKGSVDFTVWMLGLCVLRAHHPPLPTPPPLSPPTPPRTAVSCASDSALTLLRRVENGRLAVGSAVGRLWATLPGGIVGCVGDVGDVGDVGAPCRSRRAALCLQRRRPGTIGGLTEYLWPINVCCRVWSLQLWSV